MRESGSFCADCSALSVHKSVKDWMDEGSFPLYSLRMSNAAQSGVLFMRHPIVVECGEKRARCPSPVSLLVVKEAH